MISIGLLLAIIFSTGCKKSDDNNEETVTTTVPDVYKKVYGASEIYIQGDYVIFKSGGLPDHKSPYYNNTTWQNKYEAYNGSNAAYFSNNFPIQQQNFTFKIPLHPSVNNSHPATPLGPMGISLNGVPFFNQYAGNGTSLGPMELNTFDQYNGHPAPMGGTYHYHSEPFWLTSTKGSSSIMGFLIDGFPVYGPVENGITISNSDLDSYHGHVKATADFPAGIYHYHITANDPYINGNGFYGTPGTVSN